MGPITTDDMSAWLLKDMPPSQLGRPAHKPMLDATAADPAGLMVCGLMAGEMERGLKPGESSRILACNMLCWPSTQDHVHCLAKPCRLRSTAVTLPEAPG